MRGRSVGQPTGLPCFFFASFFSQKLGQILVLAVARWIFFQKLGQIQNVAGRDLKGKNMWLHRLGQIRPVYPSRFGKVRSDS